MLLEEGGADGVGDGAVDGIADDGRLGLAPSEQGDLAGLEDRPAAHGDGMGGNVIEPAEGRGGVLAGDLIEMDQAGTAVPGRSGLVETDVAGPPDAQQLEIESACLPDRVLVGGAVGRDVR